MDFKPFKKDRKPGEDGLWGWESPRLKAALEAAKKAVAPKTCVPTLSQPTWGDANMQRRDLELAELEEFGKNQEQDAFEMWLAQECPGGDASSVQSQWEEVREDWLGYEVVL